MIVEIGTAGRPVRDREDEETFRQGTKFLLTFALFYGMLITEKGYADKSKEGEVLNMEEEYRSAGQPADSEEARIPLREEPPAEPAIQEETGEKDFHRLQIRLLVYIIVTAVTFGIGVLHINARVGATAFYAIQAAMLLAMPEWRKVRKTVLKTFFFAVMSVLALFYLIGGSLQLRVLDYLLMTVLFLWMALDTVGRFPLGENLGICIRNTFSLFFSAVGRMFRPFGWVSLKRGGSRSVLKRVLIGVVIALPCAVLLFWMLATADSVFRWYLQELLYWIGSFFTFTAFLKFLFSLAVALVLAQIVYTAVGVKPAAPARAAERADRGDMLIIGTVMGILCLIYTGFILIQFRYLFAHAELPFGLTYAEYARRGFFSLMILSLVNIAGILVICRFLKGRLSSRSGSAVCMKAMMWYLCLITFVLLASAFYRMYLYSTAFGYTRLRVYVCLFLIFETAVLALTVVFIANVRLRAARGYLALALCGYLMLNKESDIHIREMVVRQQPPDALQGGGRLGSSAVTQGCIPPRRSTRCAPAG